MKVNRFISLAMTFLPFVSLAAIPSPQAKVQPVPLSEVHWTDGFWAERTAVCRSNMIPALWAIMEGTNYSQFYQNFRIAGGLVKGSHHGAPFNDGDFYK